MGPVIDGGSGGIVLDNAFSSSHSSGVDTLSPVSISVEQTRKLERSN